MNSFQYLKNLKITSKFILWFLFIALIPLVIAIYLSYINSQQALRREVESSLVAIADYKTNQIKTVLDEKEKNVTFLSHTSDIIEIMDKFNNTLSGFGKASDEYNVIDEEYRAFLAYYTKSFGYNDLLLINPVGDLIFSATKRDDFKSVYEMALYRTSELANVFLKVKKSFKTEISDFEYAPLEDKASLYIAAPLYKGADFIGIIAVEMDNKSVSLLAKDNQRFGQTVETIIFSKIENEAVFITPVRFDNNAAFKRRVIMGSSKELYAQKALRREEGSGIFIDYRNRDVLCVWRYIASFRWGIVVKMDMQEVFKSARDLRNVLVQVGLVLLSFVIFLAIGIARSVSRPIENLTRISRIISKGNLNARVEVSAKDEIGELAASFNHMTDRLVEEKAKVEEKNNELQEQKSLLEKVNKELDSFVYTVSHDLKVPLNGIYGFTDLLHKDYMDKLGKDGQEYLERIRAGVDRMKRLIQDLLALSRISRIKNPFEDVNMRELIDSAMERVEFDIRKHNVRLAIDDNMPIVHCDRIKMAEVFLNLTTNAIKFSSKDKSRRPRVDIGYIEREEAYEFFVKDNGIGIEKKYQKEVFDIFRRLHHEKDYEGTGAGLSIVKKVIDDHNGKIWIESEPGKGASFHFTLPKEEYQQKRLGEILIDQGAISKETLNKALEQQNKE
ncbi:MAG: ATP-binding protein [Candidatus Omnitrophota bacterium]